MEQLLRPEFFPGLLGIGAVLGLAGLGSAMGIGAAGSAAVGAWKKCYVQNKPAPFLLVAFIGAPLTQNIYALIVMQTMMTKVKQFMDPANVALFNPNYGAFIMGLGLFGGLAIGASAYYQGKIGAGASDALAETGKGFGQYIMALGMAETVALFVMVFLLLVLNA